MKTFLKAGIAQIFSCCPKNLSCPKFAGAAAPLAPPARTPMTLRIIENPIYLLFSFKSTDFAPGCIVKKTFTQQHINFFKSTELYNLS